MHDKKNNKNLVLKEENMKLGGASQRGFGGPSEVKNMLNYLKHTDLVEESHHIAALPHCVEVSGCPQ